MYSRSSSGNQSIIIDWYLQLLYLEYSFKIGSNELLNNVRDFIGQNRFNDMMIQLFQYICEIRSYTFSTIDPLKQQLEQSDDEYFQINNQSEIKLHSSNLENVYDICRSTKRLLDLNKNKFGHSQIFSTITKPFLKFYHHLKVLNDKRYRTLGDTQLNYRQQNSMDEEFLRYRTTSRTFKFA